jgi:hypothetical protein
MANDARTKLLLAEKKRRNRFPEAVATTEQTLFPLQTAVLEDASKRILLHPGRRGGKTTVSRARVLRAAARFPGSVIPVVYPTLTHAACKAFWKELVAFDDEHKLGADLHHTHKIAKWPNGATVMMFGADTKDACDKLRGEKYPEVFVDEVGTFRPDVLEYLVTEVLTWATMDLDGTIVLAGTPNPVKQGYMFKCSMSPHWSRYNWTARDNPTIGTAESRDRWLAQQMADEGLTIKSSKYIREFLGQWSDTFDDCMYQMSDANLVYEFPNVEDGRWTYFLAVDVGYNDPCALVVLARQDGNPYLYILESEEHTELTPSALAVRVQGFQKRYDLAAVVVDTGGLGKGYAEEMRQGFGIEFTPAKKTNKRANIEFANGDLRTGRVKIVHSSNRALIDDLRALPWNAAHTDAEDGKRDHLPDAFLYGLTAVRAYADTGLGDPDKPTPGSREWEEWRAARIEAEDEALAALQYTDPEDYAD